MDILILTIPTPPCQIFECRWNARRMAGTLATIQTMTPTVRTTVMRIDEIKSSQKRYGPLYVRVDQC